jgi:threonine synthase
MKYISTRGGISPVSFKEAVMMGLASDGGLLLPLPLPSVDQDTINIWSELEYQDLALEIMTMFIDDIPGSDLNSLISESYASFDTPEITPLVHDGKEYILELFHGPTLAFKDIALQLLGNLFSYLLAEKKETMNILGATSGDTGSAAIYGVRGRENINIFILHPHGRVSPVQALQMTTVPDRNVFNIAVEGTFDDCQHIVKELFNETGFKKAYRLGSINSINWARVLAQVVYYVYAALKLRKQGNSRINFSVPTGNFGDIFAGYVAKHLIRPVIGRLILATNDNNILTRVILEGRYVCGTVTPTISPSMDIQIASNFERYLYYLYGEDAGRVADVMKDFRETGKIIFSREELAQARKDFASASIDQEMTLDTIRELFRMSGYVVDPHTAVGIAAARKLGSSIGEGPVVCLATAHPAKFPDAVRKATGQEPELPEAMKEKIRGKQRYVKFEADIDVIRDYIKGHAV